MIYTNFNQYILEKIENDLILYHGSPYKFFEFKPTNVFFSKTPKFAIEYAREKSQAAEMDSEPNLYKVRVKGDIFDIENKEDYNKLKKNLPDEIEYMYNDFGFSTTLSPQELLDSMKRIYHIEPYEPAVKANIGDKIQSHEYKNEYYIITKKDNEYAYGYLTKDFYYAYDKIKTKQVGIFRPIYDFIKKFSEEDYLNQAVYHAYIILFLDDKKIYDDLKIPSKQDKKIFDKLNDELKQEIISNLHISKIPIKRKQDVLNDTWRFYENQTVTDIIKKLGYCGYVAFERNVETYNIFNPRKSVEIIEFEFPKGFKFTSKKEFKDYYEYTKKFYTFVKSKNIENFFLFYDRFMEYRAWKDNISVEDLFKKMKN